VIESQIIRLPLHDLQPSVRSERPWIIGLANATDEFVLMHEPLKYQALRPQSKDAEDHETFLEQRSLEEELEGMVEP
jgi:hypothetical protein